MIKITIISVIIVINIVIIKLYVMFDGYIKY